MTKGVYVRTQAARDSIRAANLAHLDETREKGLAYWKEKRVSKYPGVVWSKSTNWGKGAWVASCWKYGKQLKKNFPATEQGEKDAATQYQCWLDEIRMSR